MTVGTGGRPTVPGDDTELPTSPSLSLDRKEPFKLPKDIHPNILRARFDSLVLEFSRGSPAESCMLKVRTDPDGWRMPGLTMNEARVDDTVRRSGDVFGTNCVCLLDPIRSCCLSAYHLFQTQLSGNCARTEEHTLHQIWPSIECLSPLRVIYISPSNYLQLHRTESVRLTLPSLSLDHHLQKNSSTCGWSKVYVRHRPVFGETQIPLNSLQPDERYLYTFSWLESATTHRHIFPIDHSQSVDKTFLGLH